MTIWSSRSVRVLAVLAAACLVLAFALATMLPPQFTLAQLITRLLPSGVANLEAFLMGRISEWAWRSLAMPVLARPCWLMPVDFALIFGGIAATIALRRSRAPERKRG